VRPTRTLKVTPEALEALWSIKTGRETLSDTLLRAVEALRREATRRARK